MLDYHVTEPLHPDIDAPGSPFLGDASLAVAGPPTTGEVSGVSRMSDYARRKRARITKLALSPSTSHKRWKENLSSSRLPEVFCGGACASCYGAWPLLVGRTAAAAAPARTGTRGRLPAGRLSTLCRSIMAIVVACIRLALTVVDANLLQHVSAAAAKRERAVCLSLLLTVPSAS